MIVAAPTPGAGGPGGQRGRGSGAAHAMASYGSQQRRARRWLFAPASVALAWLALAGCDTRISTATLLNEGTPAADAAIPRDCTLPPDADLYRTLAAHRQDVLRTYAQNGWDPETKCHAIYDNWLAHGPDGQPPTTARAFLTAQGWLPSPADSATPPAAPGDH